MSFFYIYQFRVFIQFYRSWFYFEYKLYIELVYHNFTRNRFNLAWVVDFRFSHPTLTSSQPKLLLSFLAKPSIIIPRITNFHISFSGIKHLQITAKFSFFTTFPPFQHYYLLYTRRSWRWRWNEISIRLHKTLESAAKIFSVRSFFIKTSVCNGMQMKWLRHEERMK